MRLKGLAVLLLLLFIPVISIAAEVKLSSVVAALETPFKAGTKSDNQIHDFTAEFLQQSQIASIGRTQHGSGTVSFSFAPAEADNITLAKFRWKYLTPSIQEIISDGQTMWVYIPENRQVIASDLGQINKESGQNPITFLSGLGNLSKDFLVEWGTPQLDAEGNYYLQLKPRVESQFIQQIDIVVSKNTVDEWLKHRKTGKIFPIISTLVTDPNGNKTAIEFKNIKVNQQLNDNLFNFERPEGVELVMPGSQIGF